MVAQPHHPSPLPAQGGYLAKVGRFVGGGWAILHDGAPCPPWGSMQCGLVGRTLGPGRPRVTPNASAPHNGLLGPGGFAVVPINIATQQGLLPKGARPTTAMAMAAMATLLGVAYTLGGAAFVVAGGPKPCPNQLRLAPFGHHKAGMAHPPRVRVGRTRPATDTVLGFGAKVAPGVAQRFGTPLANCMGHTIGLGGQKWVAEGARPHPCFWWVVPPPWGTRAWADSVVVHGAVH